MRQARRCLSAGGTCLRRLLRQLGALDDIFDDLLLLLPLVVVAPPHRPFVFAFEPEMFTRFTLPLTFVALLSSQATCEATYSGQLPTSFSSSLSHSPERDLRCILVVALAAGETFDTDIAAAFVVCVPGGLDICSTSILGGGREYYGFMI